MGRFDMYKEEYERAKSAHDANNATPGWPMGFEALSDALIKLVERVTELEAVNQLSKAQRLEKTASDDVTDVKLRVAKIVGANLKSLIKELQGTKVNFYAVGDYTRSQAMEPPANTIGWLMGYRVVLDED